MCLARSIWICWITTVRWREARAADLCCRIRAFTGKDAEQKAAVQEAAKRAQVYERQIMLADEQKLESELKAKGMVFVETDQTGFAKKAKEAVLAAAKEELKPTIQKLYAD